MKRKLSDAALVCAFAMLFGAVPAVPQVTTPRVNRTEAASWREDLRFMAREMERRHRNLYHSVSRSNFENAVKALHERIPSLARHQIIVELARIVRLVQDGHTNVSPTRDPKIGSTTLPVKLYFSRTDSSYARRTSPTRG